MQPRLEHVMPQAMSVHPDEKVLCLYERNGLTADYKARRRWQFIYVNRGDEVAEFIRDLGPEINAPELILYSFWQDTVGQIMDSAEDARFNDNGFQQSLIEAQGESTLIRDYVAFVEEKTQQQANRSVFGPEFNRQRNLFARRGA